MHVQQKLVRMLEYGKNPRKPNNCLRLFISTSPISLIYEFRFYICCVRKS